MLHVSVDYLLGTQSLEWSKIQRVESKQLFVVETEGGRSYVGTLSTAQAGGPQPIKIAIADPRQNVVMEGPELVQITQTSENFWERFNGSINTGIIYSKGNRLRNIASAQSLRIHERGGPHQRMPSRHCPLALGPTPRRATMLASRFADCWDGITGSTRGEATSYRAPNKAYGCRQQLTAESAATSRTPMRRKSQC